MSRPQDDRGWFWPVVIVVTLIVLMACGEGGRPVMTDRSALAACGIAWEHDQEGANPDSDIAGQIYEYGLNSDIPAITTAATRYGPAGTDVSSARRWQLMMDACRAAGWREPS